MTGDHDAQVRREMLAPFTRDAATILAAHQSKHCCGGRSDAEQPAHQAAVLAEAGLIFDLVPPGTDDDELVHYLTPSLSRHARKRTTKPGDLGSPDGCEDLAHLVIALFRQAGWSDLRDVKGPSGREEPGTFTLEWWRRRDFQLGDGE